MTLEKELNSDMSYPLLEKAPAHESPEFITYLRENNPVILENDQWIVIENCKYHTKQKSWYTAFHKGLTEWYEDVGILWYEFGEWQWLKRITEDQTVKRFHIHLYKP